MEWISQAISKVLRDQKREVMYLQYVEMHRAVNLEKAGVNKKARVLWALTDSGEEKEKVPMTREASGKLRVEPKCDTHHGKHT